MQRTTKLYKMCAGIVSNYPLLIGGRREGASNAKKMYIVQK